jgi:cytosine/adenosine deaminase-related metal-dependent hydrolase
MSQLSPKLHSQVVEYEVTMAQSSQVAPGEGHSALEAAREAALAALEELVRAGVVTRYEEWPGFDEEDEEEEGDALYFAAYAPSRRLIEEKMAKLSIRLTRQYGVPVLFVSLKDA